MTLYLNKLYVLLSGKKILYEGKSYIESFVESVRKRVTLNTNSEEFKNTRCQCILVLAKPGRKDSNRLIPFKRKKSFACL